MDRRLLILGIVLIIIGVGISASYASKSLSSLATGSRQELAIAPNSTVYSSFTLNSTSLAYVVYNSNQNPIDFYLVNSSAFDLIQPYLNKSSFLPQNVIAGLEGRGLYIVVKNGTRGIFPYNSSLKAEGFSQPLYIDNSSPLLGKGVYYMVYRNPGNATANTSIGYVLPNGALINNPSQLSSSSIGLEGGISALFVLAGIVLAIYSFISPGKEGATAAKREDEIERIYKRMEKKEGKRGKGRKQRQ